MIGQVWAWNESQIHNCVTMSPDATPVRLTVVCCELWFTTSYLTVC
jgi:hypothetical protein